MSVPWDRLGNNVDNCEDLVYECAKSASSDDDVACRQVTISLTLGRTGWKAEVIEVKAEEACAGLQPNMSSRIVLPFSLQPNMGRTRESSEESSRQGVL